MNFSKLPLLQCTYQVNRCEYELNYCKLIENDATMSIVDNVNKAIENPSAITKLGEFKNSMIIKPTSLNSFKKVTTLNRIKGFNNSISIGRKPTTELSDGLLNGFDDSSCEECKSSRLPLNNNKEEKKIFNERLTLVKVECDKLRGSNSSEVDNFNLPEITLTRKKIKSVKYDNLFKKDNKITHSIIPNDNKSTVSPLSKSGIDMIEPSLKENQQHSYPSETKSGVTIRQTMIRKTLYTPKQNFVAKKTEPIKPGRTNNPTKDNKPPLPPRRKNRNDAK